MASGGSFDDFKARKSDKPKRNRKPPRFGTSYEAELSLNSELQRSENEERRSLPNNLSWTGGEGSREKKQSKPKSSPGDQFSSDSSPARFTRKKHTPATIPRTKFSTSASQNRAMDELKQHLTFTSEDETQRSEEHGSRQATLADIRVNNERNNHQQSSSSRGTPQRNQENGSGVNPLQLENATKSPPNDHSRVVNRLKQVRGYLRQATSLYITLSSKSTSPDEATDEDLEQLEKLAKLIKDLKAQEKAYVDFVQRNIAVHGESSLDNTPSTSVVSLDGETQDDAVSEQSEDLEGLRQQHALLRQMVEQQKQLKELQDRQNTLLDLQRRAENQLKEAEAEGRRISSLMSGHAIENGSVSGRSRSGTERSDESRSAQPAAVEGAVNRGSSATGLRFPSREQPAAVGGAVNRGSSATGLRFPSREQAQPDVKLSNEQKPENFKNRRLPSEQAAWVAESTGSQTPDNEAQALAAADAAQERLELESKLMDLQAKKEQMDALVGQLQQLKEMQLGKEMARSQERNVNETIENGEDDVPFATRSAKDTGDNVDDEKILEALQLHKKLRKLQDVRDKLESLKELFEEQQERAGGESDTIDGVNGPHQAQQSRENQGAESQPRGAESQPRGADGGAISEDMPPGSFDWILNSGIDDPELLTKLRQVKAAKERVANLKQRMEQNNVAQPYGRAEAVAGLAHAGAVQDEDSTVQTDNETTGSASSSLMWQEDPEFQEKLRKLNAARKKLKRLQELVKKTEELPIGPNGRPYLPVEIDEMSFSSEEDDASTATEGGGQDADRDEKESEEDATSETLVQEEANHAHGEQDDDVLGDSELEYMDKLTQQRAALSHLLAEKQRLLETQEHLNRLRQSDAMTQTRQSDSHKPLDSFIHNPTEASTSRQGATVDSTTQTLVSSEPRRDKYPQSGTTSNTLLWRELRRQRELQEQKLKKRKERLMLERKGRRSGLENASEDEGFGRSTLSADITTATWGGSTQMSSTQNDSAVSEGSSHDSDEEILVEVEDDASDGIVQAEEEEEANSEVDIYPTTSTVNRSTGTKRKQNANQKRLLFEGLRKQDLERHERFKGWQNSLFPSGNKKNAKKPQRFSNPEELNEEDRYSSRERSMWERQLNVLQGQLENTTSLCNTLLRDQQTLISVLLNRGETPQTSRFGQDSFSQYQQRQQEALQGIQNYFEQQRFLVQQQQMLQNLTECYSQMQQQHEDMLHLQQSFSQLFTHTSEERTPSARPATADNPSASTLGNSRTPNSFSFQPSTSRSYRPQDSLRETPPLSPFSNTQTKPSVERHVSTAGSSTSQQPSYASMSFPCLPGLRNRQFQFVGSTNPDTGVPSPEASTRRMYNQATGSVKPVSARVVSASNANSENPSLAYNPVTYSDSKASGSSNVVVGKQFPTPLRATAAAQLAEQDKSNWRGVKRRRQEDKVETDSISSHQSSLPGDSERPGTESDAQSDYSLFEALRDSIYAEVATLISQNESRPHFLIELFRELQLLGSDYLRQRALYSLRDLVTRFLKDDPPGGTIESAVGPYSWLASGSEQTPSESAGFSEIDQDQDKMKVPEISTQGIYDYVEAVDSGSSLSTPNSGNHEPFASEFLGETVIHLDKALKSMRERDRRDSERSSTTANEGATGGGQGEASSAGDIASESSLPDIQYPKIDTQALDRQIKKIMAEVIPCLNDHMEDTCSVELLEYIRKMVMGMVQQKNEAKEFSKFFHKQLESILQDSLAKFIGKRMKDCGEDLLVDISEILFNELAFYKLMQELDGGAKAKFFNREQKYRMENAAARNARNQEGKNGETSGNTATEMKGEKEVEVENENAEDQEDEGSSSSSSEWQVVDETPEDKPQDMISREQLEQDEETLGRDRDDAMAEEFDETRNHAEAADTESSQCINVVELSMSESRPLARDDEEESEVEISGDVDEENAEGAVWNGSVVNGNHGAHHNTLPSQMATAEGAEASAEDEQRANGSNQNKQEEDQDDDLPTKFTGLTEADLQVKIAEELSRNDGIGGIVVSMDDGNELAGDPNAIPEPAEGSALVNGDANDTPGN